MTRRAVERRLSRVQPQCTSSDEQVPPAEIRTAYLTRRGVAPALIALIAAAAFGEARERF